MIIYRRKNSLYFLLTVSSLILILIIFEITHKSKRCLEHDVAVSFLKRPHSDLTKEAKTRNIFKCRNSPESYVLKDFYQLDCDNPFLNYISQLNVTDTYDVCQFFDGSVDGDENQTLYSRIKGELQYFTKNIDANDIANMSLACPYCHHLQIIDGELYVVPREKAWSTQTRSRSAKTLFKQVVDTFKSSLADLELFFTVGDIVELATPELNKVKHNVPVFGISKNYRQPDRGLHPDSIVLYPCFTFWSWPEPRVGRWRTKSESIAKAADRVKFNDRIPKVLWRGAQVGDRSWLTGLSGKLQHDSTLDLEFIRWEKGNQQMAHDHSENYKTLEQHCEYKYLLHQEGVFYSSRLKYLLLCGSAVIFASFDGWEEYWYHLLKHDHNVLIFMDKGNETLFKNLTKSIMRDNAKGSFIGRNGRALVQKYLNEQAVLCYLRNVLIEYSKLFSYKPLKHPNALKIDDFLLGYSN